MSMDSLIGSLVESRMKPRPGRTLLVLARSNGSFDVYRASGQWLGKVYQIGDGEYVARSLRHDATPAYGDTAHSAAIERWGE